MATVPTRQRTPKGRKVSSPTFIQRSRAKGAAEKAFFHNISGGGKSRVVRRFLGLTDAEARELGTTLMQGVMSTLGGS